MEPAKIEYLIREALAANRGPGYEIAVTDVAANMSTVDVELRFLSGRIYCCAEPGCHIPRLETVFRSCEIPQGCQIRWHCKVEKGLALSAMRRLGCRLKAKAMTFYSWGNSPIREAKTHS